MGRRERYRAGFLDRTQIGSPCVNLGCQSRFCIPTLRGYGSATERLALQQLPGLSINKNRQTKAVNKRGK